MIPAWISFLFAMLAEMYAARRDAQVQFLKLQLKLMKQKLPGNRVILSPEDRLLMLRAGKDLDHHVMMSSESWMSRPTSAGYGKNGRAKSRGGWAAPRWPNPYST